MEQFLMGGIATGSLFAGLFFFKFWRQTRDRFFLLFALAFGLEAGNRLALAMTPEVSELAPIIYLFRLVGYGMILTAVWQKNRRDRD